MPDRIRNTLLSPLVPAISAILAGTVGILGSEFFPEVVSAFPFCCFAEWGSFSWKAFLFWLTLLCLGGLVFARHHVEAKESRILPLADFRGEFARLALDTTFALEANVPRQPTGDNPFGAMKTAIRDLLSAITSLALRYDGTPLVNGQPARYAANVMVFIPSSDKPPYFDEDVLETLKFVDAEQDYLHLRGVLSLRCDLSNHTGIQASDPDPDLESLALPIPKQTKYERRWRVLNGAPLAFTNNQPEGQGDVSELMKWYEDQGDFRQQVLDDLRKYFQEHERSMKSFISWPLVDAGKKPIAVVSLHANRPYILGPRERREVFQAMTAPFFFDLANCVALLRSEEEKVARQINQDQRISSATDAEVENESDRQLER